LVKGGSKLDNLVIVVTCRKASGSSDGRLQMILC
jgi:hypothetical protein